MLQSLLFVIVLLTFQLGQLGRISFLHQDVNIYVYEVFLVLFFLSLFFLYKVKPLIKLWSHEKIVFLFPLVLVLGFLNRYGRFTFFENFVGFAYMFRLLFYLLFALYFFYHIKQTSILKTKMHVLLFVLALSFAVSSILQYLFYPDLRNLEYLGWDPHLYRMFGVFFDASIAGCIFGLFIIFFLLYEFKKSQTVIKILVLSTFFILLFLTYSRFLLISMIITLFSFLFLKKKTHLLLVLFMLFLGVYIVAPKNWGEGINLKRTFSIQSRIRDYSDGLALWTKAPLFGVGYNRIRYERQKLGLANLGAVSHAGASYHSSYLIIFVTAGLFGLLSLLYMQYVIYIHAGPANYFLIFIFIASLGDNIFLHPFILFLTTILMTYILVNKSVNHPSHTKR